jgi:hypothetical protein
MARPKHKVVFKRVFERIIGFNLKKCDICVMKVRYMDHKFVGGSYLTDESEVEAVHKMGEPKLGHMQYRDFWVW